jgi:hypothetical protein
LGSPIRRFSGTPYAFGLGQVTATLLGPLANGYAPASISSKASRIK